MGGQQARPGTGQTGVADLRHTEELSRLESRNVGKPIGGARGEVTGAANVFEYYAGAANKVFGQAIPSPSRVST